MRSILAAVGGLAISANALAGGVAAPDGANAYIVSPKHGEVVSSPVKVVFGLSGIGVAQTHTAEERIHYFDQQQLDQDQGHRDLAAKHWRWGRAQLRSLSEGDSCRARRGLECFQHSLPGSLLC